MHEHLKAIGSANRATMDIYLGLIKSGIKSGADRNEMQSWVARLVTNPAFRQKRTRDPSFEKDLLTTAGEYIR